MKQFLDVWDQDGWIGLATGHPPILVTIKPGANLVHQRQYPIPLEAQKGIAQHIQCLRDQGILSEVQSAWNNPLLPIKNPRSSDYGPVQDLPWVNKAIETIHPFIPNPYTLLSLIPPTTRAFTYVDLKDAFFCLWLAEASRPLFTFEWEDPDTGAKRQLTWSRLPQGFKNSPNYFWGGLSQRPWKLPTKRLHYPPVCRWHTLSSPDPGGLQKWNRRTTAIPIGSRIQSLTKESTNLSRGGHMLGISPESREKKAGNWEKRSDPSVPAPRVPETTPGISGCHRLLLPMDPGILGHCWATLCGTKGEPHRTVALGPWPRRHIPKT
jgi:hypothetical protein